MDRLFWIALNVRNKCGFFLFPTTLICTFYPYSAVKNIKVTLLFLSFVLLCIFPSPLPLIHKCHWGFLNRTDLIVCCCKCVIELSSSSWFHPIIPASNCQLFAHTLCHILSNSPMIIHANNTTSVQNNKIRLYDTLKLSSLSMLLSNSKAFSFIYAQFIPRLSFTYNLSLVLINSTFFLLYLWRLRLFPFSHSCYHHIHHILPFSPIV